MGVNTLPFFALSVHAEPCSDFLQVLLCGRVRVEDNMAMLRIYFTYILMVTPDPSPSVGHYRDTGSGVFHRDVVSVEMIVVYS